MSIKAIARWFYNATAFVTYYILKFVNNNSTYYFG